jgi:hypothetical protein
MDANFEYMTNLQYKVRSLNARVQAFESGEKYTSMKAGFKAQLSAKDREIRSLKSELADAHAHSVTMRNLWWQVLDDADKAHTKELANKDRRIKELEARMFAAEGQRDELRDRLKEKAVELYRVETELEEEKGNNKKLVAQIKQDYENSSIPSSQKPGHKKIANNREKTDRRPGGQPGHAGHPRKRRAPTNLIEIPAPEEYTCNPDYQPTGKTVNRQVVGIRVDIVVDEYRTPEFLHVRTGRRVHADFPAGMVNEVNYDGSIKAIAFLLNNYCNVSIAKVAGFLSELTGGDLNISAGMINGLSAEFASKTEEAQKKAFAEILISPAVHVDFTSARVNGRNVNVMVCATPKTAIYLAREHKGHDGIKGTPIEDSLQTFIHDHDKTFYHYGGAHQECLDHVSRYLKGSIENEANLQWNKMMRALIREMIHFKNGLDPGDERDPDQIDPGKVNKFEARYDRILSLAKGEYEYEPPSKYYREGFNLYRRMAEYRDSHLLFLHDRKVPHSNNLAERLLRIYKRKQRQVMAFRSFGSLDCLCQSVGVIASLSAEGKNLYESVSEIFGTYGKEGYSAAC